VGRRIAVFGTGYLGATHAACMAELGHDVIGVDVDGGKLAKLAGGELPFFEPGLAEVLSKNLATGKLRFTTSYPEAAEFADICFICVGTPQKHGELGADLRYVESVVNSLSPLMKDGGVIFGKSTVPAGTAAKLIQRIRELTSTRIDLAWNPEFLREGFAIKDTLSPDRIVVGVDPFGPGNAEMAARDVYASMLAEGVPFLVTDLATAELVKAAANAFLATKISFINAIAEVCEATGADVTVLADAIGHDGRIGRRFLNAGIGFGGGCLPKDIRAFIATAGELGAGQAFALLREVDSINMRRRNQMVEVAREVAGGTFVGARVAILGAAFKPDSDDVRDSPALNIAGQIQLQGASVSVYDPQAMQNARQLFPTLDYASGVSDACAGADLVMVLTEWKQFSSLDPRALAGIVRRRTVIDGRNCLDPAGWRGAGWTYRGIGRP
jgi:UDPglucose 6-dehydrogenase